MTAASLPITGYLDRFSHRPGESFAAYVSMAKAGSYQAKLVRVISGDPNPNGPGLRFEDLAARFAQAFEGGPQETRLGSYGLIENGPVRNSQAACTWTALAQAGILDKPMVVLSEEGGGVSITLAMAPDGVEIVVHGPSVSFRLSTSAPLRAGLWCRLWASIDPATGKVIVGQQPLDGGKPAVVQGELAGVTLPSAAVVMIGAEDVAKPRRHFTGKIEDPAILNGSAEIWSDPLASLDTLKSKLLAGFDFAAGMGTQAISDVGPQACHGKLVNFPNRAMVGTRWSGDEHCWRHAPRDYAAIHFHDDDLDDCRWKESFSWQVPDDLRSGAYAFHLTCTEGEDWLPFYVLPKREGPFAPVVFLASTFTYQAYANHARGNADAAYKARAREWGAYPNNPDDHPDFAYSTYNRHRDDTGVSITTRRRPILTMRPGFLTFNDAKGSGLRHYPADTHLLAWLEEKQIAFDIVTDEDLDDEGVDLIKPYKVLLTGSHPEYHTPGTLDALEAYTRAGPGRLVYLGGNGFYWRIARDKAVPHLFELRRAEGGIRAWEAQPGEYYHQIDGGLGGLWRRNRRPPQKLAGVGFSGQGLFEGTHYRLMPAAREPEHAWVFDGIEGETIGDYGLSGGGAAGFELDRADVALGTPHNTVILARSEEPPASFVTVPEELLSHLRTVTGEEPDELKRAEIVYFDTASGGAVFAVGSITFCGSLWRNGFEGPVSQMLENVVRRFAT